MIDSIGNRSRLAGSATGRIAAVELVSRRVLNALSIDSPFPTEQR